MEDITIKEIVDLVESEVTEGENRIQKMFDWHYSRGIVIVKWLLGAAASISVAVFVSLLRDDFSGNFWYSILIIISAICSFVYGIYRLYLLRKVHQHFVATLKLYKYFHDVSPFISKYREAIKR